MVRFVIYGSVDYKAKWLILLRLAAFIGFRPRMIDSTSSFIISSIRYKGRGYTVLRMSKRSTIVRGGKN